MKLTKRDTILLAVIGAVAVIGGFFWFVIKPARAELGAQRDQLAQIRSDSSNLRDTIGRMSATTTGAAAKTADRLRLAKAVPDTTQTPGVVVQLQRLADQANVQLTSVKTDSYSDYGSLRATEFEVRVTGRFFDVDDFLYRLHRQVTINERDQPVVDGRLFATTSVDLTLDQSTAGKGGAPAPNDRVVATSKVLAFSAATGATAAGTAPTTAVSSPATGTTSSATTTTTTPGTGQAVATPKSGGTQ